MTIVPPPGCPSMILAASSDAIHDPVRWTLTASRYSSKWPSSYAEPKTTGPETPALLYRTSMRPNSFSICSNISPTYFGSDTSPCTKRVLFVRPRCRRRSSMSAFVSRSGEGRRPVITTFPPRSAASRARLRPIPVPPPVITTTFPARAVSGYRTCRYEWVRAVMLRIMWLARAGFPSVSSDAKRRNSGSAGGCRAYVSAICLRVASGRDWKKRYASSVPLTAAENCRSIESFSSGKEASRRRRHARSAGIPSSRVPSAIPERSRRTNPFSNTQ